MIAQNIDRVKASLPKGVRLVAVSKIKPVEDIMEAYRAGQRLFGENYATELRDKHAILPDDIQWHFIGHLQAKQLKYYIDFVSMIHGVDSVEHLEDVNRAAAKAGRVVDVLLQCHIAREETKFGFSIDEVTSLDASRIAALSNVRVCGVMGMATNTPDEEQVRAEFHELKRIFDTLRGGFFAGCSEFSEVSMGMSHDYNIAISEGSTIVRLGTTIFGPRDYTKKPVNH